MRSLVPFLGIISCSVAVAVAVADATGDISDVSGGVFLLSKVAGMAADVGQTAKDASAMLPGAL